MCSGVVPAHNVTLDLKNTYATYRRRQARARRVRLPAHVVDLPGADPADRRRDEARATARSKTAVAILLAAQDANWGPIQYAGELHDRATYRYFWELVQKARVTGVQLPADAVERFFKLISAKPMAQFWLMKSEPDVYSMDMLVRDGSRTGMASATTPRATTCARWRSATSRSSITRAASRRASQA